MKNEFDDEERSESLEDNISKMEQICRHGFPASSLRYMIFFGRGSPINQLEEVLILVKTALTLCESREYKYDEINKSLEKTIGTLEELNANLKYLEYEITGEDDT
jgi:hypothetical protein